MFGPENSVLYKKISLGAGVRFAGISDVISASLQGPPGVH